jgi:enoyl-CoA hydratase/carnithine racemase
MAGKRQSDEAVTLAIDGTTATLTLNRPDTMNAMSQEMMSALDCHVTALAERNDIRVVIITGMGRAFSAGGNLIEFETAMESGGTTLIDFMTRNQSIIQKVEDLPMVVIAAVGGVTVAGGLELLLCCDIVVAAKGAKIGDGHARYAVIPTAGATVRLTEKIGPARASELFFTGKLVDAEILKNWGLVNEVIEPLNLSSRVQDIAEEIAVCSPEAIRAIKELLRLAKSSKSRSERFEAEISKFKEHQGGRDLIVGLEAFREKIAPNYKGQDS